MSSSFLIKRFVHHWLSLPTMSFLHLFCVFLILSSLPSSSSSNDGGYYTQYQQCRAPTLFTCGSLRVNISYPFTVDGRPDYCGYPGYRLTCNKNVATINMKNIAYMVKSINYTSTRLSIVDLSYVNRPCPRPSQNTTLDTSLFYASERYQEILVFMNCSFSMLTFGVIDCLSGPPGPPVYYQFEDTTLPPQYQTCGLTVTLGMDRDALMKMTIDEMTFGAALQKGFTVGWTAGVGWCSHCTQWGGVCGYDADLTSNGNTCYCPYGLATNSCPPKRGKSNAAKNIGIGVGVAIIGSIAASFLFLFFSRRQKRRNRPTPIILGRPSLKGDAEPTSARYQTQIFSYRELEEATQGFIASGELGDGAFGAVYKGKLRDGRVVAVKRFYEGDGKNAMQQFVSEVELLSQLQHRNLVRLYGCTTLNSRALLLVYEYVPNGTVADHLHGSLAKGVFQMTWPNRMSIAIETADALSYLHRVEPQIIHRDVKTTNILLDNNFHVKVADVGLSRLFPANATHESTAPMGTPGYVDPDYQKHLQLTDKSDVYSFGVVLLELISSKPAFDISRKKDEIILADMAMNKIQKKELNQFVDPRLDYNSDPEIKRMIDLVAELALRCLQADKELRPPMNEVLEGLRGIESGKLRPWLPLL